MNKLEINQNKINPFHLSNNIEKQKGCVSRQTSSRNKDAKDDIISNDENSREAKCNSSKLKTVEEDNKSPIITGTEELIDMSIIHTDNDTIEHELNNSKWMSYKNGINNNNEEYEFELHHSKIDSKNERDNIFRNNLDNNTKKHECELQKGKRVSNYQQDFILRNNLDNNNIEDEYNCRQIK